MPRSGCSPCMEWIPIKKTVMKDIGWKIQPNWLQIPGHPYRIVIFGGSGSWKTNSLFNLVSQQPDIDKISLYAKDP